jgi:hypothetical protein
MAEHNPILKVESGISTDKKRHTTSFSSFGSHVTAILFTSIFWGVILFYFQLHRPHSYSFDLGHGQSIFKSNKFITCGNSLGEAMANECQYDMLSNHFVHPLCLDEGAVLEYQQEGNTWIGYTDMNWTDVIPTTKAMGESGVYWTNQRDHIVHCAMLWRKQWRAFTENRRYWDNVIAGEEHVLHCSEFLMEMSEQHEGFDWREKPMTVEVGYGGCVDRGAWKT